MVVFFPGYIMPRNIDSVCVEHPAYRQIQAADPSLDIFAHPGKDAFFSLMRDPAGKEDDRSLLFASYWMHNNSTTSPPQFQSCPSKATCRFDHTPTSTAPG